MKKVGIFSGTFDPVHEGHLAFARQAVREQGLDKVVFLVEPKPRYKQNVTAYTHRLRMIELAILNEPKLETFVIDQASFTVRTTLPLLIAKWPDAELYLMLGDDILEHMAEWLDVKQLIRSVVFIIAARYNRPSAASTLVDALKEATGQPISYDLIEPQKKEISSRTIRGALIQQAEPQGLPEALRRYIKSNKLYTS